MGSYNRPRSWAWRRNTLVGHHGISRIDPSFGTSGGSLQHSRLSSNSKIRLPWKGGTESKIIISTILELCRRPGSEPSEDAVGDVQSIRLSSRVRSSKGCRGFVGGR